MNKTITAILLIMIFFLSSCTTMLEEKKQNLNNEKNFKEDYNDGIYTEEGDIWKYGNENATVVIIGGRITSITLRKLDNIGREVDYEEWYSKDYSLNLKKHKMDLAQKMLEKQTYDVDSISGATISSENWKRAVQKALNKARK